MACRGLDEHGNSDLFTHPFDNNIFQDVQNAENLENIFPRRHIGIAHRVFLALQGHKKLEAPPHIASIDWVFAIIEFLRDQHRR